MGIELCLSRCTLFGSNPVALCLLSAGLVISELACGISFGLLTSKGGAFFKTFLAPALAAE